MKTLSCSLILLLIAFQASSQSEKIRKLESSWQNSAGTDYIEKALELSTAYFGEGFTAEAAHKAENAYNAAKKLDRRDLMAQALYLQGVAVFEEESKKGKYKGKGPDLFEKSVSLIDEYKINNPQLLMDNLKKLRFIAEKREKTKELGKINERINKLEEDLRLRRENQQLNKQVVSIGKEKQELDQLVKTKDQVINNMTEEQAKRELELARQKNLLDSIAYQQQINQLKLNEAQAEALLEKSQRRFFLTAVILLLAITGGLFFMFYRQRWMNRLLEQKNNLIEQEKKRSDALLLNILPKTIADELKVENEAKARRLDQVTILFTDFFNFTRIAEQMSPEELVADLDYCFRKFDRIMEEYGLEKIKTIGDAYMCAAGVPEPLPNGARNIVRAALEMQQELQAWKERRIAAGKPYFEARIGIHTGTVVAGVVGYKKFAYDIWGDTVNIAARMESASDKGCINVSAATHALVRDEFRFEYRGKLAAKNKGDIDMYYVLGEKKGPSGVSAS